MAESKDLKSLLMKVKEESETVGLKCNIQKAKIMASSPITSWQIDGETGADFIFLVSKITADGDCSHEIKTPALCKKSYDLPRQHIKKQRHCFSSKKKINFTTAVSVHSDFGAQENKVCPFPLFPHLFAMK